MMDRISDDAGCADEYGFFTQLKSMYIRSIRVIRVPGCFGIWPVQVRD